jgi:hypothetical protein
MHDYQDGRGEVLIFWCSDPFWSHDHGEPWEVCGQLTLMKRQTVGAVARCAWDDEAERIKRDDKGYSPGANDYGISTGGAMAMLTCRENAKAWQRWIEES